MCALNCAADDEPSDTTVSERCCLELRREVFVKTNVLVNHSVSGAGGECVNESVNHLKISIVIALKPKQKLC